MRKDEDEIVRIVHNLSMICESSKVWWPPNKALFKIHPGWAMVKLKKEFPNLIMLNMYFSNTSFLALLYANVKVVGVKPSKGTSPLGLKMTS